MSLKKYLLYVKTTKGTKVLTKVFYNDTELSTYVENQYQECNYTYRQI